MSRTPALPCHKLLRVLRSESAEVDNCLGLAGSPGFGQFSFSRPDGRHMQARHGLQHSGKVICMWGNVHRERLELFGNAVISGYESIARNGKHGANSRDEEDGPGRR